MPKIMAILHNIHGGNQCGIRYSDAFSISEQTLLECNAILACSDDTSRSLLECSSSCKPEKGCVGVVLWKGDCCLVQSNGIVLRDASLPWNSLLPQVTLLQDDLWFDGVSIL